MIVVKTQQSQSRNKQLKIEQSIYEKVRYRRIASLNHELIVHGSHFKQNDLVDTISFGKAIDRIEFCLTPTLYKILNTFDLGMEGENEICLI